MLFFSCFALLALGSEPITSVKVTLSGQDYQYQETGECGNGRHATCISEHTLTGPDGQQAKLFELFGGGSSTRTATVMGPSKMQDWLLKKVAGRPVRPTDSFSTGSGWRDGPPPKPEITWAFDPGGCESITEIWSEYKDARCLLISRGDQLTLQATHDLSPGLQMQVYANNWRNKRLYMVLVDVKRNRHRLVTVLTSWIRETPEPLWTSADGIVFRVMAGEASFHYITADGRHQSFNQDDDDTPDWRGYFGLDEPPKKTEP